ncbi:hypothetical protein DFP72DRAFT_959362 [Ephemerocybe angulata]|uniref:Uncharacterized protein n=1 Tax=Ephemerocybe angulata TaxID=980116 RepID=A0A8H6I838_9AGAR|nr:hypothetical protein DFP72DRAFT_959362 [Tulosesus angulatus]
MAPTQKKDTFVPSILIPSFILSMVLSAAVFGLSVVNFGLLSRWYNASVSILTIALHALLLFLMWRRSRTSAESSAAPIALKSPVISEKMEHESQSESKRPSDLPQFHIVHHMTTLLCFTFLTIIYLVAFGIMMDVTIRGGKNSTLPSEREKGMTYPWNIKVQVAQTALVGLEAATMLAILGSCVISRAKIAAIHDEHREDIEYGLESFEEYEKQG